MLGVVGFFISISSSEFFNRLRFDRIIVMSLWPHFLPSCSEPDHGLPRWKVTKRMKIVTIQDCQIKLGLHKTRRRQTLIPGSPTALPSEFLGEMRGRKVRESEETEKKWGTLRVRNGTRPSLGENWRRCVLLKSTRDKLQWRSETETTGQASTHDQQLIWSLHGNTGQPSLEVAPTTIATLALRLRTLWSSWRSDFGRRSWIIFGEIYKWDWFPSTEFRLSKLSRPCFDQKPTMAFLWQCIQYQ